MKQAGHWAPADTAAASPKLKTSLALLHGWHITISGAACTTGGFEHQQYLWVSGSRRRVQLQKHSQAKCCTFARDSPRQSAALARYLPPSTCPVLTHRAVASLRKRPTQWPLSSTERELGGQPQSHMTGCSSDPCSCATTPAAGSQF